MSPRNSWSPPILEIPGGASRIAYLAFVITAAAMAALVLFCMTDAELRGPGLVIAGPVAAVCGAVAWWLRTRALGRRVSVHAEGVCERRGEHTTSLRYDQVARIEVRTWQLHMHAAMGGAIVGAAVWAAESGLKTGLPYDATQVSITLVGDDGRKVVLRKWDKRWLDAYGEIRARVEPRLLGLARAELARGGTAAFGPVRVASDAIAIGSGEALALGDLERIDVTSMQIAFRKRGKRLPAARVRMSRVPNLHVMLDLVGERRAGAGVTSPAA